MSEFQIHPSSTVGPQVELGPGVDIGPNCLVDGRTKIGAGAVLVGGVTLVGDAEIGPGCRLEAGAAMTMPATAPTGAVVAAPPLVVGARTRIGAGAVLTAGVRIGADAWIEAGSVVTRDVPSHAIVRGSPGTVVGFGGRVRRAADLLDEVVDPRGMASIACEVAGVKLYRFPRITDSRGNLSFGEFGRYIPFTPQRYFLVYEVPAGELRGGHAHATCQELLLCLGGSVTVAVDDGNVREEIVLDSPDLALYLPSRVWGMQYKYSPGAVLLCFASLYFDPQDYIHSYDDFVQEMKRPA